MGAGYLQLAGGTNSHTVDALGSEGLFLTSHDNKATVAGVAYGGYARKVMSFNNGFKLMVRKGKIKLVDMIIPNIWSLASVNRS